MKKIILYTGVLFILFSCADNFDEINTNKQVISKPEFDQVFCHIQSYGLTGDGYEVAEFLFHDYYSQYFANLAPGVYSDRYLYQGDWQVYIWHSFYDYVLVESKDLNEFYGDDPGYTNALAELDIYMCFLWSIMSDTWGDIPYFKVPGDDFIYDPQEEIYYDLLNRLTNAVSKLEVNASGQHVSGEYDLIFNGDVEKWRRFGNSMRLRLAMRISNIAPEKAKTEAVSAIHAGCMESNDDVAKMLITSDIDTYSRYYFRYMCVSWNSGRISKTFTDHMYSETDDHSLDPRAPIWLTDSASYYTGNVLTSPAIVPGSNIYTGLQNGLGSAEYPLPTGATDRHSNVNIVAYKDFIYGQEAYPVMFYSEVLFLKAEAALRGWISEDANELYKEGISASMDYVGVAGTNKTAYLSKISDLEGSNEAKLKKVITQKWIADFPNGREGWADFRRTDYPDLNLPKVYHSNSTVAVGKFIKRICYIDNSHLFDESKMPEELNNRTKDRMDIQVWWDTEGSENKSANGLMNSNFE